MTTNAATVDVEDYFHVEAFSRVIDRRDWDAMPRRVEANTEHLLAIFERAGRHATFFTLGWVADRHPALIRRIVAGGHELASHGYGHQRVDTLSETEFAADVARAKTLLEDTGGVPVHGYRAPTFSIGKRTPWAAEILFRAGYRYSSSTYPIQHDLYGDPDGPRAPYQTACGLWEVPMSTARRFGRNFPVSGGGFFRLLPYPVYRRGLRHVNNIEHRSGVFYIHPWEVDPGQPRIAHAGRLSRFRHYLNLNKTEPRLDRLLHDFEWDRMDRVFPFLVSA